MKPALTAVHLHGHLAQEFGERFDLGVLSPAEAVRGLAANFPNFQQHLIRNNLPGYHVIVEDTYLGERELVNLTGHAPIHFVPKKIDRPKNSVVSSSSPRLR